MSGMKSTGWVSRSVIILKMVTSLRFWRMGTLTSTTGREKGHNKIVKISPYKVVTVHISKKLVIYTSGMHRAALTFIVVFLANINQIFTIFLAVFWFPVTPDGNIWLFSC